MRFKLHRDFERMSFITVHYDYLLCMICSNYGRKHETNCERNAKKVLHKYKK